MKKVLELDEELIEWNNDNLSDVKTIIINSNITFNTKFDGSIYIYNPKITKFTATKDINSISIIDSGINTNNFTFDKINELYLYEEQIKSKISNVKKLYVSDCKSFDFTKYIDNKCKIKINTFDITLFNRIPKNDFNYKMVYGCGFVDYIPYDKNNKCVNFVYKGIVSVKYIKELLANIGECNKFILKVKCDEIIENYNSIINSSIIETNINFDNGTKFIIKKLLSSNVFNESIVLKSKILLTVELILLMREKNNWKHISFYVDGEDMLLIKNKLNLITTSNIEMECEYLENNNLFIVNFTKKM